MSPPGKQGGLFRGMISAAWTPDGLLYAEFPEFPGTPKVEHHIVELNVAANKGRDATYKLEATQHIESGRPLQWKADGKNAYTLTASSIKDGSVQWTRSFADDQPGYRTNQTDGDLIFSSLLTSGAAKEKLRADTNAAQ